MRGFRKRGKHGPGLTGVQRMINMRERVKEFMDPCRVSTHFCPPTKYDRVPYSKPAFLGFSLPSRPAPDHSVRPRNPPHTI